MGDGSRSMQLLERGFIAVFAKNRVLVSRTLANEISKSCGRLEYRLQAEVFDAQSFRLKSVL